MDQNERKTPLSLHVVDCCNLAYMQQYPELQPQLCVPGTMSHPPTVREVATLLKQRPTELAATMKAAKD